MLAYYCFTNAGRRQETPAKKKTLITPNKKHMHWFSLIRAPRRSPDGICPCSGFALWLRITEHEKPIILLQAISKLALCPRGRHYFIPQKLSMPKQPTIRVMQELSRPWVLDISNKTCRHMKDSWRRISQQYFPEPCKNVKFFVCCWYREISLNFSH